MREIAQLCLAGSRFSVELLLEVDPPIAVATHRREDRPWSACTASAHLEAWRQAAMRGALARRRHPRRQRGGAGGAEEVDPLAPPASRAPGHGVDDVAVAALSAARITGGAVDEWRRWLDDERQNAAAIALMGGAHPYAR